MLFDALAPHGGAWRFSGVTKLGYSDPLGVPNGVEKISLKRAANGQGKIVVRASGAQAPTPALPVALPLTVQLQAAHGPCFAATFSAPGTKTNGPIVFSGKSD